MLRILILGTGCLLVVACSETDTTLPSMDASVDMFVPADAAPDANQECARDSEGRCQVITWTDGTTFIHPTDHHTTFVHENGDGAYLYVAGGFHVIDEAPQTVYDSLTRAPIAADGSLGAWENVLTFDQTFAFHAQAQTADRVYLMGGTSLDAEGPFAIADVTILELNEVGAVRARPGRSLNVARVHGTAEVIGNTLYLVGGTSEGGFIQNTTLVSQLDANGTNGPWTEGPALPNARTHHAAVVHDGRIYLFGGFTHGDMPVSEVWRSVHDSSGVLTSWETVGMMDEAPWTASAFVYNDSVYIVGGGYGLQLPNVAFLDRVRRAPFLLDGHVGAFEDVANPLPLGRSHTHQTPTFGNHIYSVGGRHDVAAPTSINNVFVGSIDEVMIPVDGGVPDSGVDAGPSESAVAAGMRAALATVRVATVLCDCAPSAFGFPTTETCQAAAGAAPPPQFAACRDAGNLAGSEELARGRSCFADAAQNSADCFEALVGCGTSGLNNCIDLFLAESGACFISEAGYTTHDAAIAMCAADTVVGTAPDGCNESLTASSATGTAVFSGNTFEMGDHRAGSCGGEGGADIAFRWDAPTTHNYKVTAVPEASFLSTVYVLDGSCAGTELACDASDGAFVAAPSVTFAAVEGHSYYFIVDGSRPHAFGPVHLDIETVP